MSGDEKYKQTTKQCEKAILNFSSKWFLISFAIFEVLFCCSYRGFVVFVGSCCYKEP